MRVVCSTRVIAMISQGWLEPRWTMSLTQEPNWTAPHNNRGMA